MRDLSGISEIFERCIRGTATEEDRLLFWKWAETPGNEDEARKLIGQAFASAEHLINIDAGTFDSMMEAILNANKELPIATPDLKSAAVDLSSASPHIHHVHFLKAAWFRYAAIVVILMGASVYLWLSSGPARNQVPGGSLVTAAKNITPGGNRAVLTLADGATITLDSASSGPLARQGNAQIIKHANGAIVYNVKGLPKGDEMMNTMSTPKGGQYQLILPDGTKVWLNAASSITYPAVFTGNKRHVTVTGEAYFEVALNKEKPFIVDAGGNSLIEVLGTSFNINSYADEKGIKTILLEGSVKVTATTGRPGDKTRQGSVVILRPGQQAQTNDNGAVIASNADIEQAVAWKNGLFNFNGSDLRAVMRQLERWYDIKVKYEGSGSDIIFKGEMYRNVNLSDVLDMLHEMGNLKFRMEANTLVVL